MEVKGSDIDLDQLVEKFKYIINVGDIARAAKYFIEHIIFDYEDQYNLYNNLREKFREKQFGKMYILGNSLKNVPQIYRFEIKQVGSRSQWQISTIEPNLPPGVTVDLILPPYLINYIGSYKAELSRIYSESKILEIDGKRETFDVQFARCFDRHIIGTVCKKTEIETRDKEQPNKIERERAEKLGFIYDLVCNSVPWDHTKHTDEENFIKMFTEMQNDAHLKDLVFESYFTKMNRRHRKNILKLSE